MIALIKTKNIMNNKLKTKTKRAAALILMLLMLAPLAARAQVIECRRPTELAASNIESNSAIISWVENGPATSWIVAYATSNDNDYTEVDAPTAPFTLTGLVPATQYIVKVLPVCEVEKWSDEITFTTQCEPITITADAPYTQGFEIPQGTASNEEGPLPYCWKGYSTNTSNPAPHNAVYEPVHNGTQSLGFYNRYSYGDLYAILPEFDTELNQLQISFWMQTLNCDLGQFQLGYITADDDGTCNTFTAIETYGPSEDIMTQRTTYLDGLPTSAHRLVFKKTSSMSVCFIDDVLVMLNNGCYFVQNLRRGGKSHNHIYLSWDLVDDSQTEWDVQVATDADFTEIVANLVADSHENYLLDGLDASTRFFVRVKPTCNDNLWSNTLDFTTLCEPIEVSAVAPYTEGFESPTGTGISENGPLPDCWEAHSTSTRSPHNCNNANYAHSGSQSLVLNAANSSGYAILPEFSNPVSDLQISFWMRIQNNTDVQLQLGYITAEDDGTCNTFTPVETYANSVDYVQRTTDLDDVPLTAVRLVFKWVYSYANDAECYIDDVLVTIDPCSMPQNLAVGNLTQETADITWEGLLCNYAVRHRTAAHYDGTVIDEPFNIDELPACWDRYQITSIGSFLPTQFGWLFTTYGLGAYNMRCRLYDPNTNYWLVTPGFTVGENYTLSFDVALTDHDNSNPPVTPCNDQTMFIVKITTDNMSSWQTLCEWNNSGSEYVLNNIPHTGQNVSGISLADYAGQNVRIAFHCVRTDNNYDWVNDLHIDNVLIGNPVAVAAGEWTDPVAVTGNTHSLSDLTAGMRYEAQVKSNLDECDNWSEVLMFKTLDLNAGKFFLYEGNWNEAGNWVPAGVPTASDNVFLRANATIPAGIVAYANAIKGTDEHTLTLKDGGQLFHYQNINNQNITVTLEKEIAGHDGSSSAGWHFIGSPVVGANSVTPSAENGFLVNDYDLYYYDEPTHYWMNHKPGNSNSGFGLSYGRGYLYANDEGTTLKISGKVRMSELYVQKYGLTHEAEVLNGFNLVGNPFLHNARINATAYVIDNGAVVAYTEGIKIIAPGEGVMLQTTFSNVHFQRVNPDAAAPQPKQLQITVSQEAEQRGEASSTTLLDNAIINFKDGGTLEKFDFGRTDARVYIPQGGKDYAIVCAEGQNEMPLNFKAIKNGTYTLTFDVENVEFDYLHLIDNLTGADPPLRGGQGESKNPAGVPPLQRGQGGFNYTFTAKTTDYASRFRLVFSANPNCGDAIGDNAPFAYISNGNIVINGTGTLQIIDILGKELVRKELSTFNSQLSTSSFVPGVYVLRLIQGENIKTQKIVIQ